METSTSISFSADDSSTDGDYVMLVQDSYSSTTGVVSTINIIKSIANNLYDSGNDIDVDCGLIDDAITVVINAYPSDKDLSYSFGVTHGTIKSTVIKKELVTEYVTFGLQTTATIDYPVQSLVDLCWRGDLWDADGNDVDDPDLDIDGRTLSTPVALYGTARVKYWTWREQLTITINPRSQVGSGVYDSVAYAQWDGGVVLQTLTTPTAAEENYNSDQDCGWTYSYSIKDVSTPAPTEVDTEDSEEFIDYCTQEEIDLG